MPRYSFDHDQFPDSIEPESPCEVIDGDGVPVDDCILANTDTGEVVREKLNAERTAMIRFTEFRLLPLVLRPIRPLAELSA